MSTTTTASTYVASGMSCGSCVGNVTAALGKLSGIDDVDIDLTTGAVTVTGASAADAAQIQAAVERLGFELVQS
ncbi:heavy-metal-associated domain-containing protein [Nocardia asteroides NBRC 15531]|uniref:Copper chaperone CopZ n=1 Tax=Nocardia asteroides NBRC 15531 TaxID=1110697 RepID=U5E3Z2_NOCAS|nr:heavy metal-associated domain-containing protein [Nocardia asteroides]TLF67705.1 heavy-metal-associated domain-containing protein [Nocardia asteroides NBRC 15531]UGT50729.1 heavy-metal-associated domain-containing protein [Nocardia asteroides]SFN81182.1 Copper chaperone CopZ [Nocardia asteroides]VEG36432.1 Copper chaperone CopZ [Nocardia asteroides]GAD83377.1 copper chaperone CopZ [Nocardia asteroides NBRC 15531]